VLFRSQYCGDLPVGEDSNPQLRVDNAE